MKKLKSELLKTTRPAIEFIRNIDGKTVVIHDDDADGVCAGVLIGKIVDNPKLFSTEWNISLTESVVEKVKKEKADYVIIIDTPSIDQKLLDKMNCKILIIDHHVPDRYENVVYCNPRLYSKDIYWPASYLCYYIYSIIAGKGGFAWIAAAGILGDHGVKDCKDVFIELKDSELIKGFELNEHDLFESKLGLITKIIDSGRVVKADKGATFVSNVLLKMNDYNELLEEKTKESKTILEWYEISKKEFQRLIRDFEKNSKQISDKIIFYKFKSDLRLKSSLASYLGAKMRDKILVIVQENDDHYSVSMRRGDDINTDLHDFIKKCIRNIPGAVGGGHPEAVGAKVPKDYLNVFLKNLSLK